MFQGDTSVVVPKCYMFLRPCVYGVQQYGHLNIAGHYTSCLAVFCNLK